MTDVHNLLPTFGFVGHPDALKIGGYVPIAGMASGTIRIGKAVAGHFFVKNQDQLSLGRMGLEIFRGVLEVLPIVGTFLLGVDAAVNCLRNRQASRSSASAGEQLEMQPLEVAEKPVLPKDDEVAEVQDFAAACWKEILKMIPSVGSPVVYFRNLQCYRRSAVHRCPFPKGQTRQEFIEKVHEICAPWASRKEQAMENLRLISEKTGIPVKELTPTW